MKKLGNAIGPVLDEIVQPQDCPACARIEELLKYDYLSTTLTYLDKGSIIGEKVKILQILSRRELTIKKSHLALPIRPNSKKLCTKIWKSIVYTKR